MSKEKYLANIDKVLEDFARRNSGDVGDLNKIAYSEELEQSGAIKKIAFDVFRVNDDPYNSLWTVEDINGQAHLVRSSDPQYSSSELGDWTATSNYDRNDVSLAYKKTPIARFSSDKYGYTSEEIITFKMALLDSVKDEAFLSDVLKEQPQSKLANLVNKFPEFKKIIKG